MQITRRDMLKASLAAGIIITPAVVAAKQPEVASVPRLILIEPAKRKLITGFPVIDAQLPYGLQRSTICVIAGHLGAGKTTLINHLLEVNDYDQDIQILDSDMCGDFYEKLMMCPHEQRTQMIYKLKNETVKQDKLLIVSVQSQIHKYIPDDYGIGPTPLMWVADTGFYIKQDNLRFGFESCREFALIKNRDGHNASTKIYLRSIKGSPGKHYWMHGVYEEVLDHDYPHLQIKKRSNAIALNSENWTSEMYLQHTKLLFNIN